MTYKKIIEILKNYTNKTGALYCYVIDKDGFILASYLNKIFDLKINEKILIKLYSEIERIYNSNKKLLDFHNNIEVISYRYRIHGINDGFKIIINAISENLTFISLMQFYSNYSMISRFQDTVDRLTDLFYPKKSKVSTLLV